MVWSILNLSYLVGSRPLKHKKELRTEIFNEFTIYVCCNLMTTFLNIAMPVGTFRDNLGWAYMGIVTLNILINIGLAV